VEWVGWAEEWAERDAPAAAGDRAGPAVAAGCEVAEQAGRPCRSR
jgi:hypothetical protein